jgi:hypothetical protein
VCGRENDQLSGMRSVGLWRRQQQQQPCSFLAPAAFQADSRGHSARTRRPGGGERFYSSVWSLQKCIPKKNFVAYVRERTIPSDRRLSAKLVSTITDSGFHVTDPYGRVLRFLDRSRYFFLQVPPHLYSRGQVHPVPDPLLLR